MRPCAADVNGDGHFDLFTANYGPNGLFLNRGGGKFEDVSRAWGVAIDARYDACAFADFDNDGRLDLYVNGTVTGGTSYRDYLLPQHRRRFEDVTPENIAALQADHGAAWADFDARRRRGSRAHGLPAGRHALGDAEPAAAARHRAIDSACACWTRAAARRVRAPRCASLRQGRANCSVTRLVDSGSGYDAQNDLPVHFGLASVSRGRRRGDVPGGGQASRRARRERGPADGERPAITVRVGGS